LQGSITGNAVYVETHNTVTNQFGLVNLEIGNGNVVSGVFANINWPEGLYFIKTEMDAAGGTNYQLMGTSQLLSVPYSFYSGLSGGLVLTDENGNIHEVTVDTMGNLNTNIITVWTCGDSLTDTRDGHIYNTVQIGTQCWMAKNLAYLPTVSPSSSASYTIPLYYVYDYQGTDVSAAKATTNYQTYGVLYNWVAAMAGEASSNSVPSGVHGICPVGWHLPSDEEWKILEGEVDSYFGYPDLEWDSIGWRGTDAGGNLKETGTTHWNSPNTGASNSSGFTTLPGGYRIGHGDFVNVGDDSDFWSSTEYDNIFVWYRRLHNYNSDVNRGYYYKDWGLSVRCLED